VSLSQTTVIFHHCSMAAPDQTRARSLFAEGRTSRTASWRTSASIEWLKPPASVYFKRHATRPYRPLQYRKVTLRLSSTQARLRFGADQRHVEALGGPVGHMVLGAHYTTKRKFIGRRHAPYHRAIEALRRHHSRSLLGSSSPTLRTDFRHIHGCNVIVRRRRAAERREL
jgi:hypothetical protein